MTLEELATKLYDAKRAEDAAKKLRIEAEDAIAAIVETPENGSKTVTAGALKVVVKRGMTYKADIDAIRSLSDGSDPLPLKMTDPIPAGYAFDEKAYEALRESNPALFNAVAMHVERKPKKTSVELKLA